MYEDASGEHGPNTMGDNPAYNANAVQDMQLRGGQLTVTRVYFAFCVVQLPTLYLIAFSVNSLYKVIGASMKVLESKCIE